MDKNGLEYSFGRHTGIQALTCLSHHAIQGSHLMRQQVHRGSIDCQDTATGQQVSVARVLTLGRWSCIDQHRRLPYRANSIDSIDSIGSSETACLTLLPLFDHYSVGSRQLVRG